MSDPLRPSNYLEANLFPDDAFVNDFLPPVVDLPQGFETLFPSLPPFGDDSSIPETTSKRPRRRTVKEQTLGWEDFPRSKSGSAGEQWSGDSLAGPGSTGQPEVTKADGSKHMDAVALEVHRQKNRQAQKRFRLKQREKINTSAREVEKLTTRMAEMQMRQRELEARNRILEHTCELTNVHLTDLTEKQEAYDVQQELILRDSATVYRRGLSRPDISVEELKQQGAEYFIESVFPSFLDRYRQLLASGGRTPNSPEWHEICETVKLRRAEENRVAMFSQWTLAVLAWNREEMQTQQVAYPNQAFWMQLLAGLELTAEQENNFVEARRRFLGRLNVIRQQREKAVLALGLALMQQQSPGASKEEQDLRASLEDERQAVLDFLYSIIDQTLTPVQEAFCDISCYPWAPDLWMLSNLLAAKRKGEPPDTICSPEAGTAMPAASSMLPHHCTAEMLCFPLLARGAGLQLKRGLASIPVPQKFVGAKEAPPIARMRQLTVFDIMCGKHLSEPAVVASPN